MCACVCVLVCECVCVGEEAEGSRGYREGADRKTEFHHRVI